MPALYRHLMQRARRLSTRMLGLNYLHRGVVLLIDTVCSTAAGLLGYAIADALYDGCFAPAGLLLSTLLAAAASIITFLLFRFYKVIIRHSSLRSLPRIIIALALIALLLLAASRAWLFPRLRECLLVAGLYFAFACTFTIGVRVCMISVYYCMARLAGRDTGSRHSLKVFLCGRTADAAALADFLNAAYRGRYLPAAIIDMDNATAALRVGDMRMYSPHNLSALQEDIRLHVPDAVLFTSHQQLQEESGRLVEWCNEAGVKLLVAPPLDKCTPDAPINITPVRIEDLLERPEIRIDEEGIAAQVTGATILVTGAAGSIGSELVRQLCKFAPARLILLDNAETPLHLIRLEIEEKYPKVPIVPAIADVRNKARCSRIMEQYKPGLLFHAAAYKHVPLMEEHPCEAVLANVQGSANMAQLALEHGVSRFVMVSTDKAVNPTNVMGATKRAAEMYVQALDAHNHGPAAAQGSPGAATRFITTRFGNVLGSNGSVVPRFREQIAHGGPVTVTHPDIIRYFMTIPEACRLVLQAAAMGHGGEIFVFDMGKPVRIAHLARRMIQLSGYRPGEDIRIVYTGLRPGEKLYEEVLSTEESTTQTSHEKIRIARAIDTSFADIDERTRALLAAASAGLEELTVLDLKDLVPEYISNNSPFEKLDKKHKQA